MESTSQHAKKCHDQWFKSFVGSLVGFFYHHFKGYCLMGVFKDKNLLFLCSLLVTTAITLREVY